MQATATTRADRIHAALSKGEQQGTIDGYYCQTGMPGRRWTVWGDAIGAAEYGTDASGHAMKAERTYSTRELERVLELVSLMER